MAVRWLRGLIATGAAFAMAVSVAACTGSDQAVGTGGVETVASSTVTVPPLGDPDMTPPAGDTDSGQAEVTETSEPTETAGPADPTTKPSSDFSPATPVTVTSSPEFGSSSVAPGEPITLSAQDGRIVWATLTTPAGKEISGTLADDGSSWTMDTKLGFGKKYKVQGVAVNTGGMQTEFSGKYVTATTIQPVNVSISPRDGAEVGIAAPVMITLGMPAEDKALIERNVKIVTDPPVEGSWAWVQHAGYTYPGLDWRPKDYWPAGTKVHVEANLYGLKFSDNWYGGDDVSVDFVIGRNQIVKANAKKQTIKVFRDGKKIAQYYGSFGRGDVVGDPNLVTRSGIHVVTSKHEIYKMSNPEYGYEDATEYWAVRISNNGEFIHNNPGTSTWQLANVNKTHGCINLSWDDAKAYFESAMYGDPVEITGTSIELSRSDGDIWIWTVPWKEWLTMSALSPDSIVA